MLLKNRTILIMGIRNKWSIAYGIAKSAYENGAKLLFTYMGEENKNKIEELISEFSGSKAYVLNGASEDEKVKETFMKIKKENGKIDGIVHAIAHANTEDLHNDFIYTSKDGYAHAVDVSSYSFVLVSRIAKEIELLNENDDIIKKKTVDIQAGSLLSNKKVQLDKEDVESKEKLANGLYAVLGNDSNKTYFLCLYDNQGVIRSEIPFTGYRADRLLFKDGLLYMSVGMNKIAAMNRLGQVEKIYSLGNYEMHHDYVFGKDNSLLILADEKDADTVEDLVLSLDLETGEVTIPIDLKTLFSSYMETTTLPEKKDQLDWMHINAIQYDEENDSVLLSSR